MGPTSTKEPVTTISASNNGIAISSMVLTSVAEGGGTTTANTTTTVTAPVVTRSLTLEFDTELPSGYEQGPVDTTSSRAGFLLSGPGITRSLTIPAAGTVVSIIPTQGVPLSSCSPAFTPAAGSRSYQY
ncbi:hypothetical protein Hanom_Chr09g00770791 [Helianthus anomalus]